MDTISRLRTFRAVVEAGGFTAAAQRLGRSKALLSKHVKELEDEFGARLLNRTSRKLSLTEAGERTLEEARLIDTRLSRLRESIEMASSKPRGRLRVSLPRAIGESLLSRAVMNFAARYPHVSLEVKMDDRFVDLVAEGFDAAIRVSALTDSSLIARRLRPFRIGIYASPSFLASHGTPAHPRELGGLPCVIDTNYKGRGNWRFRDPESSQEFVVPVPGRVEVNSPVAAIFAADAGLGFTRSPHTLVADAIAEGRLVTVLEEYELRDLGIFIVYPAREHLPAKTRVFIDHMVDTLRETGEGAWG